MIREPYFHHDLAQLVAAKFGVEITNMSGKQLTYDCVDYTSWTYYVEGANSRVVEEMNKYLDDLRETFPFHPQASIARFRMTKGGLIYE